MCGMPSEWASARAAATDSGEQHERVPSPFGSAHSSSVTAIDLVALLLRDQRGHRAVDAAAHGDQRALAAGRFGARGRGRVAGGRADRAVQGVGGERGGVHLAGAEAAELVGDVLAGDAARRRGRACP